MRVSINSAEFRHLVSVIQKPAGVDSWGDTEVDDWIQYCTRRVRIVNSRSSERYAADQDESVVVRRFWFRMDSVTGGITAAMRIQFNGLVLEITGVDDVAQEHRYLEVVTVQRSTLN